MKILIVDDYPYIRETLQAQLESQGHTVVAEIDGTGALSTLARNGVLDESFDAVICDCRMPGRSGVQVLEYLRRHGLHLPFLLHSSSGKHSEDGHEMKLSEVCKQSGFAKFHLKSPDLTFDYVDEFLAEVS